MNIQIQNADLYISAGELRQFPKDGLPQIAFSGRSNVGKSSLLNTLLGRKSLARVSGSPGKTITVNFYAVDRKLYFVDLPGYGFAKRPAADIKKWSALTEGYFTSNSRPDALKLVLQLVDMKVGPTEDDRMMLRYLQNAGIPYAVVLTKSDKLNATERRNAMDRLQVDPDIPKDCTVIPFSSLKGEGKNEVWQCIFSVLKG